MSAHPAAGSVTPPRSSPGLMWKTVSQDCNLACDYCYYSTCHGRSGPRRRQIDPALLDKAVREYMEQARGSVGFAWQGGEPLLAGLEFFERVVALQAKLAPPGTGIGNALQTNGTLITDSWAQFFRKYNFLVGVSLDGPRDMHDAHRVTVGGGGSFDLVMRKIEHLRNHDVDFNVLTVLNPANVERPRELWAFYEREGFGYVQFIPGMDFRAQSPDVPSRYLISAEQYGKFLCDTFDLWYRDGAPVVSERFFDHALSVHLGRKAETCKYSAACSTTLVIEQNGDVYPCDFYISAEYRLGNIGTDSLATLYGHPVYRRFMDLKKRLPVQCRRCRHLRLCYGGCPRARARLDPHAPGPDFFCSAYRQFFEYAHDRLAAFARKLRTRWIVDHARSGKAWPERNDPCFCGSESKFKNCCGPVVHELVS